METVKKPPVHDFSGNVTVPAGSALTIKEGATVNDEAGALCGGSGGGDFILELSEDGKTVLTPISEYCAAFREGKTVKINGCYSNYGTWYNLVMQYYSGNVGLEQKAMFSSIYYYANSVILLDVSVTSLGTITFNQRTLALST